MRLPGSVLLSKDRKDRVAGRDVSLTPKMI
jgi:hypothetical protein